MPPSLADWLPADHLVWFVIEAVGQMDLSAFIEVHRQDGWGRAAYDPAMMVTLLLYAYCIGERSSRAIERRCREDVAFRVLTANRPPDHATIARFRAEHDKELAELFNEVLEICREAGLLKLGVVCHRRDQDGRQRLPGGEPQRRGDRKGAGPHSPGGGRCRCGRPRRRRVGGSGSPGPCRPHRPACPSAGRQGQGGRGRPEPAAPHRRRGGSL